MASPPVTDPLLAVAYEYFNEQKIVVEHDSPSDEQLASLLVDGKLLNRVLKAGLELREFPPDDNCSCPWWSPDDLAICEFCIQPRKTSGLSTHFDLTKPRCCIGLREFATGFVKAALQRRELPPWPSGAPSLILPAGEVKRFRTCCHTEGREIDAFKVLPLHYQASDDFKLGIPRILRDPPQTLPCIARHGKQIKCFCCNKMTTTFALGKHCLSTDKGCAGKMRMIIMEQLLMRDKAMVWRRHDANNFRLVGTPRDCILPAEVLKHFEGGRLAKTFEPFLTERKRLAVTANNSEAIMYKQSKAAADWSISNLTDSTRDGSQGSVNQRAVLSDNPLEAVEKEFAEWAFEMLCQRPGRRNSLPIRKLSSDHPLSIIVTPYDEYPYSVSWNATYCMILDYLFHKGPPTSRMAEVFPPLRELREAFEARDSVRMEDWQLLERVFEPEAYDSRFELFCRQMLIQIKYAKKRFVGNERNDLIKTARDAYLEWRQSESTEKDDLIVAHWYLRRDVAVKSFLARDLMGPFRSKPEALVFPFPPSILAHSATASANLQSPGMKRASISDVAVKTSDISESDTEPPVKKKPRRNKPKLPKFASQETTISFLKSSAVHAPFVEAVSSMSPAGSQSIDAKSSGMSADQQDSSGVEGLSPRDVDDDYDAHSRSKNIHVGFNPLDSAGKAKDVDLSTPSRQAANAPEALSAQDDGDMLPNENTPNSLSTIMNKRRSLERKAKKRHSIGHVAKKITSPVSKPRSPKFTHMRVENQKHLEILWQYAQEAYAGFKGLLTEKVLFKYGDGNEVAILIDQIVATSTSQHEWLGPPRGRRIRASVVDKERHRNAAIYFTFRSLLTLIPGAWLDDKCIDWGIRVLTRHFQGSSWIVLPSTFWAARECDRFPDRSRMNVNYNHELLRKQLIVCPLRISKSHWICTAIVNPGAVSRLEPATDCNSLGPPPCILFFDSFAGSVVKKVHAGLVDYLNHLHVNWSSEDKGTSGLRFTVKNMPAIRCIKRIQQRKTSDDCGLFTIRYAASIVEKMESGCLAVDNIDQMQGATAVDVNEDAIAEFRLALSELARMIFKHSPEAVLDDDALSEDGIIDVWTESSGTKAASRKPKAAPRVTGGVAKTTKRKRGPIGN